MAARGERVIMQDHRDQDAANSAKCLGRRGFRSTTQNLLEIDF